MDTLKCYETLNVTADSAPEEIRKAYVGLSQVWQPERYQNAVMRQKAQEKMQEIQDAYNHLATFIPELKRIEQRPASATPEVDPAESALVDDSHSPVQWTIIFVMCLVFGFIGVIGYHLFKAEKASISSLAPHPVATDEASR